MVALFTGLLLLNTLCLFINIKNNEPIITTLNIVAIICCIYTIIINIIK